MSGMCELNGWLAQGRMPGLAAMHMLPAAQSLQVTAATAGAPPCKSGDREPGQLDMAPPAADLDRLVYEQRAQGTLCQGKHTAMCQPA